MQPDARARAVAEGLHLVDRRPGRCAHRVAVRVAIAADPARPIEIGRVAIEHDEVAFQRVVAGVAHPRAQARDVVERADRIDTKGLVVGDVIAAAMRPVEPDRVAQRAAQHLMHRDAQRLRLDVDQRVLQRPDGARRGADRHAPAAPPQLLDGGLHLARVLADQMPAHMLDQRCDRPAHIALAEIGPAGEALVRAHLHEVEVPPARAGDQDLDPRDLHAHSPSKSQKTAACAAARQLA